MGIGYQKDKMWDEQVGTLLEGCCSVSLTINQRLDTESQWGWLAVDTFIAIAQVMALNFRSMARNSVTLVPQPCPMPLFIFPWTISILYNQIIAVSKTLCESCELIGELPIPKVVLYCLRLLTRKWLIKYGVWKHKTCFWHLILGQSCNEFALDL